ncbi:MAG TPA: hypothetical protein VHZ99_10755 [Steroidobacteraceae bacterium]|jgi:MFS family permease|nr:hypothetical protein [Steroidobacteraceae bacterium]
MSERDPTLSGFMVLLAGALVFTWQTGNMLPAVVASHFDRAGVATGYLPRAVYRGAMIVMLVLPALLVVVLPRLSLKRPDARINVPNREYWLAPERRAQTVAIIVQRCTQFGMLLILFLCYAHWLVVHANREQPPTLSSSWLLGGLVVFLGLTARWAAACIGYFRTHSDDE